MPDFAFDPLLSSPIIWTLGILAVIAAVLTGLGRLRSLLARLFAAAMLIFALLNPQSVEEDREALPDEILILKDVSESVKLGERAQQIESLHKALVEKLDLDPTLEVTTTDIPTDIDGTRMMSTLIENLGQLPQSRLAGVIALTDGQIHDLPENAETILPDNVPFHAIIIDDPNLRDRRIRAITAPRYGLVGEQAEFVVRVDDPGHEGERAPIEIKLNGEVKARFSAIIGDRVSIPLEIERRGINTIELTVRPAEGELTTKNNLFVGEISGIRDRMRVLLVTGEPHRGGRAWRNLLKSDPAVEMVHFTILTNPGTKVTNANQNELSLIAFPTRQLFEEKLDEFDLIIFDQFTRRRAASRTGRVTPILLPYYIQNIAEYVEDGGALLVATGPAYASENSLFRSPLAAVLPARPTGEVIEYSFSPKLNDKGRRHPVTAPFFDKDDKSWGNWFRIIESNVVSGDILMTGEANEPLMVIEQVGEGRVAMLLSDQAWLWSRGYDGGGPYSEVFRRLAHWLLGEPDLDAEKLTARTEGDTLMVERRTLSDNPQKVVIRKPDGKAETLNMKKVEDGLYRATTDAAGQGAYRLTTGELSTVTAIGALNPKEFSNLVPTTDILNTLTTATGGTAQLVEAPEGLPNIRRIKSNQNKSGAGWIGIVAHEQYVTRASRRTPLAPGLLYFILALMGLSWAWLREGR